jgi:hypothetical protein
MPNRPWKQLRSQWMGVLALLLVLTGGTAYAAKVNLPKNTVKARHIAPNAVGRSELANDAVSGAEVEDGSLAADDFAVGELPTGPPGARGPAGAAGPHGPSNVYARFKDQVANLPDGVERYGPFDFGSQAIVTLPLPEGSFHIQAKAFANGQAGNVGCALVAGADVDGSIATLHADGAAEPLAMQVLHTYPTPGNAELRCTDYGGSVRGLFWVKVHATQVESITNPAAS